MMNKFIVSFFMLIYNTIFICEVISIEYSLMKLYRLKTIKSLKITYTGLQVDTGI